jgi:glycosyltransferase involved in cell wall biosynthesis
LASSRHAAGLLQTRFAVSPQRVYTLPDSVDPAAFRPRGELSPGRLAGLRRRLDLPAGRPLLVYLGLLAPYQGTDLLLDALRLLVEAGRPVHGLIMGFPDVERYRRMAGSLGVGQRVTFTGAVPFEQSPWLLALGDVALAPKLSATEGSGKLLTYMASALPVVAFDTPVHREYLGDLGYFAPPGDAAGLAAAVERALNHPAEAARRGERLRAAAISRYTWQHAAVQIEQVYASLLAERP